MAASLRLASPLQLLPAAGLIVAAPPVGSFPPCSCTAVASSAYRGVEGGVVVLGLWFGIAEGFWGFRAEMFRVWVVI